MNILSMSRFVPEQICDTLRFTQFTGDRNISQYCGYASDFISQVLSDDSIDGAVFPKSCDSTRILPSYLQDSGKFLYQIHVPSFNAVGAEAFYASSIRKYKESIEKHFNIVINDIKIRSEWINQRNAAIKETYKDIYHFSYSDYLHRIHNLLQQPLFQQKWDGNIAKSQSTDRTVFLIGSFMSNIEIINKIENAGLTIVGDSLPESGRLVSSPDVNLAGDIYNEISHSILSTKLSPTQNNFNRIIEDDILEIKKKAAKGVIFVIQKYCEAYEYLYGTYASKLKDFGIKTLKLSIVDTADTQKIDLALEAFADTFL